MLVPHRRDGLIEWMKTMLMHSFVLNVRFHFYFYHDISIFIDVYFILLIPKLLSFIIKFMYYLFIYLFINCV